RDAAEALRGSQLVVPRALLEEAEADEYYVVDLIGCEVMLDEARLGVVVDVQSYPTCDVLVVNLDRPLADPADPEAPPPEPKKPGFKKKPRRLRPPRLEVPMAGTYVRDVDLATRRVVLATIEGL
ncbi:MAG: hypothetical protein KC731_38485, partial [Myxococcales bacterium]|nr:hypothetical protein [Myxococcales bacterium]